MQNKSNSVDAFIKFILAGKAASHQLQLFTSKPKSKLTIAATMQLHIPNRHNSATALAVNPFINKAANISTCRHRILHNIGTPSAHCIYIYTWHLSEVDLF